MCIYPARLGILIPGGLWPIAPCPPTLPRRRVVIAILRSGTRGPDYRSFSLSYAPVLTICRTTELLVGRSRGRFARHWSSS